VLTSGDMHCVSVRKTDRLILFREIFCLYYEDHMKYITIWGKIQMLTLKQVVESENCGLTYLQIYGLAQTSRYDKPTENGLGCILKSTPEITR
jgi:hypothetical protein